MGTISALDTTSAVNGIDEEPVGNVDLLRPLTVACVPTVLTAALVGLVKVALLEFLASSLGSAEQGTNEREIKTIRIGYS